MAYRGSLDAVHETAPLDRKRTHVPRNTYIEDEPQVACRHLPARGRLRVSPPRLNEPSDSARSDTCSYETTPASDQSSDASSMWSKRSSHADNEDLYNLTDDESIEVPLMISESVRKAKERAKNKPVSRYPSLVIPSPSAWPMPPGAQKVSSHSIGLSPVSKIGLSPARMSMFAALRAPSRSATPSLDGSLTSEELAVSSCPSTPDIASSSPATASGRWSPPIRLDADAFAMLHQINPDAEADQPVDPIVEVAPEELREMHQLVRQAPIRRNRVPETTLQPRQPSPSASDPTSALSVPSPGGFFASLRGSARQTWCVGEPPLPSTVIAERFYGVPWRSKSRSPPPPLSTSRAQQTTDAAQRGIPSPQVENAEVLEIADAPFEYDKYYQDDLVRTATASLDRTKDWLSSQFTFVSALAAESPRKCEVGTPKESQAPKEPKTPTQPIKSCFSPDTPDTPGLFKLPNSDESPASKKSVRFMETIPEGAVAKLDQTVPESEPIFFQGFQYVAATLRCIDIFLHGRTRAEAAHVQASSLPQAHREQLRGRFQVTEVERPAPSRPISSCLPSVCDDEHKEAIAAAERERQALEQILPSVWEVQAANRVFGRQLISSPVVSQLTRGRGHRILDYGGQTACDWAWHVAVQFPATSVFTVSAPLEAANTTIIGPHNHHVVTAENPAILPFPDEHFDVVSARSLYSLLKTHADNKPSPNLSSPNPKDLPDEVDNFLSECLRVLKPGGYLEFNLLDAELLHPAGPVSQALSVEFAFNLRQLGYDPALSRSFLPRLRKAGFADIKRAWLVLPSADVRPKWVDQGKMVSPSATSNPASGIGTTCSKSKPSPTSSSDSSPSSSATPTPTPTSKAGPRGARKAKNRSSYFSAPAPLPATKRPATKATAPPTASSAEPPTIVQEAPPAPKVRYDPPLMGSTDDVRAMTGLVGARAWERWMLRLTAEMGGDESAVSDRVCRALEECGRLGVDADGLGGGIGAGCGRGNGLDCSGATGGAGWRCLLGWARKGFVQ